LITLYYKWLAVDQMREHLIHKEDRDTIRDLVLLEVNALFANTVGTATRHLVVHKSIMSSK